MELKTPNVCPVKKCPLKMDGKSKTEKKKILQQYNDNDVELKRIILFKKKKYLPKYNLMLEGRKKARASR